jgi:hypothetical protein
MRQMAFPEKWTKYRLSQILSSQCDFGTHPILDMKVCFLSTGHEKAPGWRKLCDFQSRSCKVPELLPLLLGMLAVKPATLEKSRWGGAKAHSNY